MLTTYLVLVGLCLIGLAIRTVYERSKKAGRLEDTNQASQFGDAYRRYRMRTWF